MIEYFYDTEQKTDEWFKLKCGLLSGSLVSKLITPAKIELAKGKVVDDLIFELAAQRISNFIEPSFTSYQTERGTVEEVYAKQYYVDNYHPIDECGFITRKTEHGVVGFSPDGLVGEDGFIEVKSRIQKFQVQTIFNNKMPLEYMAQVQFGFYVTQRKWCDFIQYSNGLPMFIERIFPIQGWQESIDLLVREVEGKVSNIVNIYNSNSVNLINTERVDLGLYGEISGSGE